ncbi:MAG TPA: phosphoenolpyruvate carboxykinase (ATP), partial [Bacteroidetes bacterium]|nr:phosphoenolpyruvate carboxykinase (ATP) [Bacteroidota bacterium]
MMSLDLKKYGITVQNVIRNIAPAVLYEEALQYEKGAGFSDTGALMIRSGQKTGRSPKDKRIVVHPNSQGNIWWGSINIGMDEHTFEINHERAIDYLNTRDRIY